MWMEYHIILKVMCARCISMRRRSCNRQRSTLPGKAICARQHGFRPCKMGRVLANDLGVPAAFVFKKRISGEETHVTAISANVQDTLVIIYDDMIRTGGSLVNAAQAYQQQAPRQLPSSRHMAYLPAMASAASGTVASLQSLFARIRIPTPFRSRIPCWK